MDHIKTPFITVAACIDTQGLDPELQPYCELLAELLFVSPIKDGEVLGCAWVCGCCYCS